MPPSVTVLPPFSSLLFVSVRRCVIVWCASNVLGLGVLVVFADFHIISFSKKKKKIIIKRYNNNNNNNKNILSLTADDEPLITPPFSERLS